jgi:hippurate hydrolase
VIKKRIHEICESTAEAMGCNVKVTIFDKYPAIVNHPRETEHIIRLTKSNFGPEHFSDLELPLAAGEDFSFFLEAKPGCFFTIGTLKPGMTARTLHSSDYNFNDDMIATGGYFWLKLVEDRLKVNIL